MGWQLGHRWFLTRIWVCLLLKALGASHLVPSTADPRRWAHHLVRMERMANVTGPANCPIVFPGNAGKVKLAGNGLLVTTLTVRVALHDCGKGMKPGTEIRQLINKKMQSGDSLGQSDNRGIFVCQLAASYDRSSGYRSAMKQRCQYEMRQKVPGVSCHYPVRHSSPKAVLSLDPISEWSPPLR